MILVLGKIRKRNEKQASESRVGVQRTNIGRDMKRVRGKYIRSSPIREAHIVFAESISPDSFMHDCYAPNPRLGAALLSRDLVLHDSHCYHRI